MQGEMLWFDEKKDFGFILTQEEERLYVHRSGFLPGQVPEGRCARTKVSFSREIRDRDGVAQAVSVTRVDEEAPRRARRRHGYR